MIHRIDAEYRGERYEAESDTERIRPSGSRGPEGLGYCIRILDASGRRSSRATVVGRGGVQPWSRGLFLVGSDVQQGGRGL